MRFNSFNGSELLMMLVGSANLLAERRSEIDSLNVFPVPDGDTGTAPYLPGRGQGGQGKERGNGAGEMPPPLPGEACWGPGATPG